MRRRTFLKLLCTAPLVPACSPAGGSGQPAPAAPPAASPVAVPAAPAAPPAALASPVRVAAVAEPVVFGEPVTVRLWHTQSGVNEKALTSLIERFNTTNGKGITVRGEYQGSYGDLYKKNMAAIQAKDPPEMAAAYESFVAEYAAADVVVDLDEYLTGPQGLTPESLDDIFPSYLETNRFPQYGNRLLSFPFTKSVLGLYYNADMLTAAGVAFPETWSAFADAVKKVSKKDAAGKTTVHGWAVPVSASSFNGWVLSRGSSILTPDNAKVAWNGAAGLETLQLVEEMVKGGYAYQPQGYDYQNDFGQGKVAFVFESSTGRPFFKEAMAQPFNWGFGLLPQADPAKKATVQYGANIAVFKSSLLKQAACWEFIRWFADRDQNAEWAIASSYMPLRRSVATAPAMQQAWQTDAQGKQAFDIVQYSRPEPNVAGTQETRTAVEDALTAVITGKSAPKAALDAAAVRANRALDEKR